MDAGLPELALPARRGARVVALRLLDEASEAAPKVLEGDDEEGLHDFRVAIRRLRSWIRAFDDELDDAVGKKSKRRLKALASATNPARDRQVHREWLREASEKSRGARRAGAQWLERYFDGDDNDDRDDLLETVHDDFPKVRDRLARALAKDIAVVDMPAVVFAPPPSPPTLATEIADRIGPHLLALEEATTHIHTMGDEAAAHAARIAAKQLRYLIEPARDVEGGSALLKRLRALQDALGELHDAHVMAHELSDVLKDAAKAEARRTTARIFGRVLVPADPDDAAYGDFPRDGVVSLMRKLRADITTTFATAQHRFGEASTRALRREGEALAAQLRVPHAVAGALSKPALSGTSVELPGVVTPAPPGTSASSDSPA